MKKTFYERLGRPVGDRSIKRRKQDVLYDQKWRFFLRRVKLFKYLPFVDFAFASGSLALGSVHKNSDFDVIVGARYGRIFTARIIALLFFGALGMRRKKTSHDETAKDKLCMHHWVTEKSLRLKEPHNIYWREIYRNITPIYGTEAAVKRFWNANQDWMGDERPYSGDIRHRHAISRIKSILEWMLSGKFGDLMESLFKAIQIKKIERGLKNPGQQFEPRIRYSDEELEFLPRTDRIHELTRG